ncbi:hypothetical protein RND61_24440 [Streptomyces sp. TRM76323]|uniref:Uncharacterized protein n=1 Tax=Streptomyces tamarix TaxID=3078565 RepID=A0ABU3QQX6_9ACTN|nr:hypothetical protein [Streptomyces tamarix]MDT9685185.1 hypothetical protein [Streptomyces tamarix]
MAPATPDVYDETRPYGVGRTRQTYVLAGDVLAPVVQSWKGTAPRAPFRRTLVLPGQLLG